MNIIKVPNCLDPDQDQVSVCLDLGPNCLQRLSPVSESRQIMVTIDKIGNV